MWPVTVGTITHARKGWDWPLSWGFASRRLMPAGFDHPGRLVCPLWSVGRDAGGRAHGRQDGGSDGLDPDGRTPSETKIRFARQKAHVFDPT